jgi:hypothetical protein
MTLAPIIIFAFNRLEAFKMCVNALNQCKEAKESQLYVFVDGARSDTENEIVEKVREYALNISGFKSVACKFSKQNKGLGPSIISGVTDVINSHGKAIVLEDDLIVQSNFLTYMNQGLIRYQNSLEIFSVCGYSNRVKVPQDYQYDAYFCTRSSSWGWATWSNRWSTVDWELKNCNNLTHHKTAFNDWGGSDCFEMLKAWHEGKNKSWAIRFCFSQFLQNKVSLFPTKSLVKNDGFDGFGTNCRKYSRFKYDLMDMRISEFRFPESVNMNEAICRQALSYNSIWIRVWSRLMYMLIR